MEPRIASDFRFEYTTGQSTCYIDVRESDEGFAFGIIEADRGCVPDGRNARLVPFNSTEVRHAARVFDFECDEPQALADTLISRLFAYAPNAPDAATRADLHEKLVDWIAEHRRQAASARDDPDETPVARFC